MPLPGFLLGGIEIALNRHLRREPAALQICAALAGKRLRFEAPEMGLGFVVEPLAAGVRVTEADDTAAEVCARAPALRWIAIAREMMRGDNALPAGLEIEGDADLLQRFSAALALVGIDPEEWLAPMIGGAAAHRLLGSARKWLDWGAHAGDSLAYSTADYLREESRDLASAGDVEEWQTEVEQLREDVDRFEAKLARLEAKSSQASP
jgi:ubiquinone biosynthesis protein UbiJ